MQNPLAEWPGGVFCFYVNTYEVRHEDVVMLGRSAHGSIARSFIVFMSERTYWSPGVPRAKSWSAAIDNSLCFGVYRASARKLVSRARRDGFRHVRPMAGGCCSILEEEERGKGLSKKLVAAILAHPRLQGFRRFLLGTLDAHGLYAQFGFTPIKDPERFMDIYRPNVYQESSIERV